MVARSSARLPSLVLAAVRELSVSAAVATSVTVVSSRRREKGLYTGTAAVDTKKLKDSEVPSAVVVTVKVVVALSSPSQLIRKTTMVPLRAWELVGDMEMTMLRATVASTLMGVVVEVWLVLGVGVPPGADLVVEGEGVLLGLGRLVMDSLG